MMFGAGELALVAVVVGVALLAFFGLLLAGAMLRRGARVLKAALVAMLILTSVNLAFGGAALAWFMLR